MAAAVERAERRYVAGGAASRGAGRGGPLSALAAAAPAHAPRADLSVGGGRPGHAGLRDVDEDGHAVHRQLVSGAGLENYSADHSPRTDRQMSSLTRWNSFPRRPRWFRFC